MEEDLEKEDMDIDDINENKEEKILEKIKIYFLV